MIMIDEKEYRNLQEQVGYLTEELTKLKQSLGGALPDPIAGPTGPTGPTGATGPQGRTPKMGFGYGPLPDTGFENGDIYIARGSTNGLTKGNVYLRVNNSWQLQLNLVGPQGPIGPEGEDVIANPDKAYSEDLEKVDIDGIVYNILSSALRSYLEGLFNNGSPLIEINGSSISIPNNFGVDGNASFYGDVSVEGDTYFDNNIKINDTSLDCILDANDDPLIICERLEDTNGNLRFVEDDITMENISGVTFSYNKWSLSGSHLMIVIAGTVASGTTLSAEKWCDLDLPAYVKSKISPVFEAVVERQTISAWNSDYTAISLNFWLLKYGEGLQINQYETPTTTKSYNFRIQFDLLIDMA